VKDKECGDDNESEADAVIPFEFVAEIKYGKDRKNRESNNLLNGLQFRGAELIGADAIRGHLETVFEERYPPADHDHFPESFTAKFQVAIPRKGHEDVRDGEQ
jgi:hypothetical protein